MFRSLHNNISAFAKRASIHICVLCGGGDFWQSRRLTFQTGISSREGGRKRPRWEWEAERVGWPRMVCLSRGKCIPQWWMTNTLAEGGGIDQPLWLGPRCWKVINESICFGSKHNNWVWSSDKRRTSEVTSPLKRGEYLEKYLYRKNEKSELNLFESDVVWRQLA